MEKILKIEDTTFSHESNSYGCFDGFEITTDSQVIKLGIENGQSCCETYGYFMSEDNLDDFVGSNIIDISITDVCLNTEKLDKENLYYPDTMFVNINTTKGLLQFVAYNSHNGYYSHEAIVISNSLNYNERL